MPDAGMPSPPQKFAANRCPFERNREDQEEQDDRQDLGDRDDLVDRRRLLHAAKHRKMENPDADRRDHDRGKRAAITKNREKRHERRFDQHPVERIAETSAEKIAEGGKKPEIVAKPGLSIGIDAGVEVRLTLRERWSTRAKVYMPPAAISHAMIAPKTPVAVPKARGSDQMPAPTIEPTTIMVSANSENFCVCSNGITAAAAGGTHQNLSALHLDFLPRGRRTEIT